MHKDSNICHKVSDIDNTYTEANVIGESRINNDTDNPYQSTISLDIKYGGSSKKSYSILNCGPRKARKNSNITAIRIDFIMESHYTSDYYQSYAQNLGKRL